MSEVRCPVLARIARSWWERLSELDREEEAAAGGADVGEAGSLIARLIGILEANGAGALSIKSEGYGARSSLEFDSQPNEAFDWTNGVIEFCPSNPWTHPPQNQDEADALIAAIVRVTEIPVDG